MERHLAPQRLLEAGSRTGREKINPPPVKQHPASKMRVTGLVRSRSPVGNPETEITGSSQANLCEMRRRTS
jgi:hypothetical protein